MKANNANKMTKKGFMKKFSLAFTTRLVMMVSTLGVASFAQAETPTDQNILDGIHNTLLTKELLNSQIIEKNFNINLGSKNIYWKKDKSRILEQDYSDDRIGINYNEYKIGNINSSEFKKESSYTAMIYIALSFPSTNFCVPFSFINTLYPTKHPVSFEEYPPNFIGYQYSDLPVKHGQSITVKAKVDKASNCVRECKLYQSNTP